MAKVATVAEYLAAQPPAARKVLAQVRAALRKALPGTDEVISYQIPAYRLRGGGLVVFFSGWKQHYAVYPASAGVTRALGAVLGDRVVSKGTIRFGYDEKVPVGLIGKIARVRLREEKERARRRAAR